MIFSSVLFWWPYINQSRKRNGTDILCSETDICVGAVDLPLSGWSAVSHYTTKCETEHCYSYSCVKRKTNLMPLILLFIQYSFIAQHVSAVNTTILYVEVQIQYFGDTITTCYTIHSITIRHHTIEITLSYTTIHIKTSNALINNTLTHFLYTSYRYHLWNNNQLVADSWRWSY